jgi:hypothetical protein
MWRFSVLRWMTGNREVIETQPRRRRGGKKREALEESQGTIGRKGIGEREKDNRRNSHRRMTLEEESKAEKSPITPPEKKPSTAPQIVCGWAVFVSGASTPGGAVSSPRHG